jgi:hypothetical protein
MSEQLDREIEEAFIRDLERYDSGIHQYMHGQKDGFAAGYLACRSKMLEQAHGGFEEWWSLDGLIQLDTTDKDYRKIKDWSRETWTAAKLSSAKEIEELKDKLVDTHQSKLEARESADVFRKERDHWGNKALALEAKLAVAIECLQWIAKTDTASHVHGPDVLWLTNWRNTRKQAATDALSKLQSSASTEGKV